MYRRHAGIVFGNLLLTSGVATAGGILGAQSPSLVVRVETNYAMTAETHHP